MIVEAKVTFRLSLHSPKPSLSPMRLHRTGLGSTPRRRHYLLKASSCVLAREPDYDGIVVYFGRGQESIIRWNSRLWARMMGCFESRSYQSLIVLHMKNCCKHLHGGVGP